MSKKQLKKILKDQKDYTTASSLSTCKHFKIYIIFYIFYVLRLINKPTIYILIIKSPQEWRQRLSELQSGKVTKGTLVKIPERVSSLMIDIHESSWPILLNRISIAAQPKENIHTKKRNQ